MNKRGLSDVVTTVLIILIAIAAVIIIWNFVSPAIRNAGEGISPELITTSFSVKSVVTDGALEAVIVERKAGAGDVTSLKVVLEDESKRTCVIESPGAISELSSRRIAISLGVCEDGFIPVKVSVVPVLNKDGKEFTGVSFESTKITGVSSVGVADCGNSICEVGEDSSSCLVDCPVLVTCGDGVINGNEFCEVGPPLNVNGQTCQTQGYDYGSLGCSAGCLSFDTSLCVPKSYVAYWKFDESSWTGVSGEVKDSSANGNDGTRFGNANIVSGGVSGNAGTFDGSGDYVSVPDSDSISLKEDFTISLWIKDKKSAGFINKILSKGGEYAMQVYSSDRLYNYYWINSNQQYITVSVSYSRDGAWRHVVTTLRKSGTDEIHTIYINGAPSLPRTVPAGTISTTANALTIGLFVTGFEGDIDEVRIYDRALSQSEITSLYNQFSS